ncbi:hypothetical protein [Bacillus thuringiensis]|uniref:Uncharacterized protein n=1 Tax=Bacillus thuringiensis TaxID=1428 RepID=A0A1B2RC93_BACTU|nr:hypothetical protein [Bacillus thuringiensis]AOB42275.1 hypothetical protein pFR260_178 [Bacillus thuringiensis]MBN9901660.1 hypothetical protein [Bacillus thuringiensis]MDY7522144.1 hypothetical protein [Bacillus thuringiensis]OMH25204.1 hypothetical protein BUM91_28115 [Bacillus thuringiensis]OTX95278.1 hypothetical protein BK726_02240 [Bacillus thuringiensis serovar londrina]
MSNYLSSTIKGRQNYKKLLIKSFFLSICFILISFKSNISYASEISNHQAVNTKVLGILGEDKVASNDVEENQFYPKEEISTIIKNADKSLPGTGGHIAFTSIFLGATLLFLGILMSIVKRNDKKRNWTEGLR